MRERRLAVSSLLSRKKREVLLSNDITLEPLVHEEGRSIPAVANRLSRSKEYAVSGREDLDWFMENADAAYAKYGVMRPYERIVFFGAAYMRGFPTLRWDAQQRAYVPGSSIPPTFVWNSMFGLAALREKISRKN